jgi:signal transduction histidine kinase/signal recognition particle receptor subunit beta
LAQWNHSEKTLYTKLVYYGPAYGGKTTNLESIHKITDPESTSEMLSVKTSDDRTLFFDLLPFDLGTILGYQVATKLYTVPGQVHYSATRRVVLAGADAIVFVADSSRGRTAANRESLQDLAANMQANKLNPSQIPVLIQFNKQDGPEALTPGEMESVLGVRPGMGFPSIAVSGDGVMETFLAATKIMLRRVIAKAEGKTRDVITPDEVDDQVTRAFEPFLARARASACESLPSMPGAETTPRNRSIVVENDELVQQSVATSLRLGESLSEEQSHRARLERESAAFRQLGEALRQTGASFDPAGILKRTFSVASEVTGAAVVSLVRRNPDGGLKVLLHQGAGADPLSESIQGRRMLASLMQERAPTVVNDLQTRPELKDAGELIKGFRAVAMVPVDVARGESLVAYAPMPDGSFGRENIRFLSTTAAHLSAGLEKARLYSELNTTKDHLEGIVQDRTAQLRKTYEELRIQEQVKDRFLSNLSHEIRTPLTAATSAAVFLRDYEGKPEARAEMADSILTACGAMNDQLENLFRVLQIDSAGDALRIGQVTPADLVLEASQLAGGDDIRFEVDPGVEVLEVDLPQMARAVANLLDNAVKFGGANGGARLTISNETLETESVPAIRITVQDNGEQVPEQDRVRIFLPFEQGGDPLTSKPKGIGLGLYECRAIAERHSGSLEYRALKNGGNEFRLTFPATAQAAIERPDVASG